MDKLGVFKNQLYNFMRNLSSEKPSNEKLDGMLKLMGQMEDVLYEIQKPTIMQVRSDTRKVIKMLRIEAEKKQRGNDKKDHLK